MKPRFALLPALVLLLALTGNARAGTTVARWVELAPPPLFDGAAVFDSLGDRMLVFDGSLDAAGHAALWSFTFSDSAWHELAYPASQPRIFPWSTIVDPVANRALTWIAAGVTPGVYSLDLANPSGGWSLLTTAGTPPIAQFEHSAIYDPVRRRMVVFGGYTGGTTFRNYTNRVFALTLDGTPTWTELLPAGAPPLGRGRHSAVYDAARDRMIVFGGRYQTSDPGLPFVSVDEAWSLSLSGTPAWTFLSPVGIHPAARSFHCAGIDDAATRMVVFGGNPELGNPLLNDPFGDGWLLDLAASTSDAHWTKLPSAPAPAPRGHASSAWDSARNRLVVHGGSGRADIWALSPGVGMTALWSPLTRDTTRPPDVQAFGAVLDSSGHHWLLFGGGRGGNLRPEIWTRSTEDSWGWSRVPQDLPSGRQDLAAVADPAGGRAILFGGLAAGGALLDETLAFDFATAALSDPATTLPPSARSSPAAIFDPTRRQMILYGGSIGSIAPHVLSDTWVFDAATGSWSERTSAGSFGERTGAAAIYDPLRDRMLVFGGTDTTTTFSDVHQLPLGPGGTWSSLPTTGTPPPIRFSPRAAYDPASDRLIVFEPGDESDPENGVHAWALTLSDPPTWSLFSVNGRLPRNVGAPVEDVAHGRVLFYGAQQPPGYFNQTWAFVFDETTPTTLALVSAEATAEGVTIRWYGGESTQPATAWRRTGGEGWQSIAEISPRAGEYRLVDREPKPGDRVTYRLGIAGGTGQQFYGEVTLTIPDGSRLELTGATPNPADDRLHVAFRLPSPAPAQLDVFDLQGRRVLSRPLTLPVGGYVVPLRGSSGPAWPAGVYLLRLSQSGIVRSARVVIAR